MPIKAKRSIQAGIKDVSFGRTLINWDSQSLLFQLSDGKGYKHKLTQGQWNYLVNGLQSLMGKIPNISEIEIPDFDPDME